MRKLIQALPLLLALPLAAAEAPSLPDLKPVVRKARPAVVNLSVVKNLKARSLGAADPFMQQFFGRYFGGPQERERSFRQNSLGSGVIIDAQGGYILTNNHVVDGADGITVTLADKRKLAGSVVGRDPKTDLAVVKVKAAEGLVAAPFGDSDKVDVGDWVLAIGSPFGLEQTVSHGIISAKGRVIGEGPYDDFLQTDAPINPGNSGGPLLDLDGEVIGINTAITSRSGGSEGIGFAIPSNMARQVYRELVAKGKVVRGWLGLSIQELDPALAAHFGLPKGSRGVLVSDVLDSGPAKAAGLKPGDVLQSIGGKPLESVRELQRRVAEAPVGSQLELGVWRGQAARSLKVKVASMDEAEAREARRGREEGGEDEGEEAGEESGARSRGGKLGLRLRTAPAADASRAPAGLEVLEVEPGSPAEEAGLRPGDRLLEIDRQALRRPEELSRLLDRLKPGQSAVLRVRREGRSLYLSLPVPESPGRRF